MRPKSAGLRKFIKIICERKTNPYLRTLAIKMNRLERTAVAKSGLPLPINVLWDASDGFVIACSEVENDFPKTMHAPLKVVF
jgi:hypothetical protein